MKKLIVGITDPSSIILLKGQLAYFHTLGYKCYLLAPKNDRTLQFCLEESCTLLPINIQREISIISDLKALYTIISYFRKVKPDIVNVGTPKMGLLGSLAGKITGVKKRIYTCRGFRFEHEKGNKKKLLMQMEKLAASSAHKVLCISESVKEVGVKNAIFDNNKAVVIHKGSSNGIDLDKFNPEKIANNLVRELVLTLGGKNSFIYGFVGRVSEHKGINELYQSFLNVLTTFPNSILLIVGPVDEKQIKDDQLIHNLKSHKKILLSGKQTNVPLYLSIMNVFVLPTWAEGFGNVLVEAAAMGKAVISTTGTGSRDAVKDGYNGILVEPKNVGQLTAQMILLQQDEALRDTLATNGLEWAKNFDSVKIWDGMNQLYLED